MGADIRHEGVINSIDGQKVTVRILQASACSGCQASRICRAAESKEKLVEIEMKGADSLSVGQTVTIAGEESMGMTAVAAPYCRTCDRRLCYGQREDRRSGCAGNSCSLLYWADAAAWQN